MKIVSILSHRDTTSQEFDDIFETIYHLDSISFCYFIFGAISLLYAIIY